MHIRYAFGIIFRAADPDALTKVVNFLKNHNYEIAYVTGPNPPEIRLFIKHYALQPLTFVKGEHTNVKRMG